MTAIPITNANTSAPAGAVFGGIHLIPTNPLITFAPAPTAKAATPSAEDSVQLSDFANKYLQQQSSQQSLQQQFSQAQPVLQQATPTEPSSRQLSQPQLNSATTNDQQASAVIPNNLDQLVQAAAAGSAATSRLVEVA